MVHLDFPGETLSRPILSGDKGDEMDESLGKTARCELQRQRDEDILSSRLVIRLKGDRSFAEMKHDSRMIAVRFATCGSVRQSVRDTELIVIVQQ